MGGEGKRGDRKGGKRKGRKGRGRREERERERGWEGKREGDGSPNADSWIRPCAIFSEIFRKSSLIFGTNAREQTGIFVNRNSVI